MKQRRMILVVSLLVSMLACVVPGLEAALPTPVNPDMLPTIVVLTAEAAASQTAVAGQNGSEMPPGANDSQMAGTSTERLEDGSTRFNDADGGYELILPVGWLGLRPDSDEFNASLANDGAANALLRDQMTADQAGYAANLDRLYAYILRPDIGKNTIFGFSKLVWDPEDTTYIDNTTMGELVRSLESSGALPGFRADTAQIRENGNGVSMIEIGGRYALSDGEGGSVPFYTTIVFFKPSSTSLTRITFTFLQDFQPQISTDVSAILESIKAVGP
jgi:hypothetical protein